MAQQLLDTRLGEDARHYRVEELQSIVYEVERLEDANRETMGAKDARLLNLFLAEKGKYEKQKPKPKSS